ncbi:MAG: hypothetical protein PHQ04_00220 [Opitutaceae bacterium]|nr:hypothetical protein [Opitutaceae bacterium]
MNKNMLPLIFGLLTAPLAFALTTSEVAHPGFDRDHAGASVPLMVTPSDADTSVHLDFIVEETEAFDDLADSNSSGFRFVPRRHQVNAWRHDASALRKVQSVDVNLELPVVVAVRIEAGSIL